MSISSAPTNGAGVGEAFLHNAASTSFAWALAGAPASGDVLFTLAAAAPNTNRVTALVETNVTQTLLGRSNALADAEEWIGIVSAGASATINGTSLINGSTANVRGNVSVWSGNPSVTHIAASGTSGTSTSPLTNAVTPANGVDVLILACCRLTSGGIGAPSGGFTALTSGSTGYGFAYKRVVGDGVTSHQCGWTGTTSAWDTVITAMTTPGGAVALAFTTQPAASIASGGTLTPQVTADASASGLTCTLTLTGPNGSATGLTAVHNASGVATFATVPTGDGPGYTLTAATAGYTGATSSSFTVIGAVVAANQAFVTAMGGDSLLFTVHDPRIYADGALSSFPDTIGPISGRAAGVTLTAGTAPVVASGKLTLAAASTQSMTSAADSRLTFAGTALAPNPLWLLVIGSASAAGPLAGIAADPTSTTTYPYAYAKPTGSTWQASFASNGATPTPTNPPIPNTAGIFTSDSGVAFAGGAIRAMAIGKLGYQTASNDQGTNVNHAYGFLPCMGGKRPRFMHRVTAATAGNCKLAIGRFGASYADGSIAWLGVFAGDMTVARKRAFHAFALAQFGATIDVVALPSLAVAGNSLVNSTTQQVGGDMQQPTAGSGTTSFPYYLANYTSGARNSLVTQGLDVAEVHSFAWGRSGKQITEVADTFDVELALLADGTCTGPIVILLFDVGNALAGGGLSVAQYLAACVAFKARCDTLASTYGIPVNLVHVLDVDRGSYYNASWPTIPSGYSANGTDRVTIASTMLASPLTYGTLVWDAAANVAAGALGTFAAPKCYSTTYYNITANGGFAGGDATHCAPPLYQALGEAIKTGVFDANDTLLYPAVATTTGSLGFLVPGLEFALSPSTR